MARVGWVGFVLPLALVGCNFHTSDTRNATVPSPRVSASPTGPGLPGPSASPTPLAPSDLAAVQALTGPWVLSGSPPLFGVHGPGTEAIIPTFVYLNLSAEGGRLSGGANWQLTDLAYSGAVDAKVEGGRLTLQIYTPSSSSVAPPPAIWALAEGQASGPDRWEGKMLVEAGQPSPSGRGFVLRRAAAAKPLAAVRLPVRVLVEPAATGPAAAPIIDLVVRDEAGLTALWAALGQDAGTRPRVDFPSQQLLVHASVSASVRPPFGRPEIQAVSLEHGCLKLVLDTDSAPVTPEWSLSFWSLPLAGDVCGPVVAYDPQASLPVKGLGLGPDAGASLSP